MAPQAVRPPYASTVAGTGGVPSTMPDVPVSAFFIAFFACLAAANLAIILANRRRGRTFPISGMLLGYCILRIIALALRIAWATQPANTRLALAASVLASSGLPLLYVASLLLAQRVLRARRPAVGWHTGLRLLSRIAYALLFTALVLMVTGFVLDAYTLDPGTLAACRALQLTASSLFLLTALLPLALLLAALLLPRRHRGGATESESETFGAGSAAAQMRIAALSSLLCLLIGGFRAGSIMARPRPFTDPAWYHSTGAFYTCIFMLELLTLGLLTASRIDQRFHIPDGSKGPGDYSEAMKSGNGFGKKRVGAEGLEA